MTFKPRYEAHSDIAGWIVWDNQRKYVWLDDCTEHEAKVITFALNHVAEGDTLTAVNSRSGAVETYTPTTTVATVEGPTNVPAVVTAGAAHACREGWVCEAHPDVPWPHLKLADSDGQSEDCAGPGMPCARADYDCPFWPQRLPSLARPGGYVIITRPANLRMAEYGGSDPT